MINKEIKVGSKIWLYATHVNKEYFYVVKSVKKVKTLVSVVVEGKDYKGDAYEIKMYGHVSSSMLSGYDRKFRHDNMVYTCEYGYVEDKTMSDERKQKYVDAGRALLNLAEYLK